MRIVHVADTHLGFSAYRRVCEDDGPYRGLNQREVDTYRSFETFVDRVLDLRPDAVLHSGDLFDTVRPSNRALSFALEQLVRLSEAGIPTVIIAGNHSTPRLRETGSAFRLFEHLDHIYPVYRGAYERIVIGDLTVHAVPHSEGEGFKEQLPLIERCPDTRYNVAMLHAGIVGFSEFRMNEFNEQLVESCFLKEDLDYIALGHYHQRYDVTRNASYAGSTEHFSFAEAGQPKGFVHLDLSSGRREFIELPVRPMVDLGPVDAHDLDPASLRAQLESLLARDLEGKIVRLVVKRVPRTSYVTVDFKRLRELASRAVHFEPKFEVVQDNISVQSGSATLSSLEEEFVHFLDRYPIGNVNKDALKLQGLDYLKRGLEGSG
ncbi:MAG: exonuclease SbcCD subunit D [Methanomassiliicoccus sp.]|nr:exonuclease SbcCD subunit D [Methanomassiliicoccus sp.]